MPALFNLSHVVECLVWDQNVCENGGKFSISLLNKELSVQYDLMPMGD